MNGQRFGGFRSAYRETVDGKVSAAFVCALLLIPAVYLAILLNRPWQDVWALVIGGIGSLVAQKRVDGSSGDPPLPSPPMEAREPSLLSKAGPRPVLTDHDRGII